MTQYDGATLVIASPTAPVGSPAPPTQAPSLLPVPSPAQGPAIISTQFCWSIVCQPQPGVSTTATCLASICIDATSSVLYWTIDHNVQNATVSHIHDGQGIIVGLSYVVNTTQSPMNGFANMSQDQDTRICSGYSYVNIHSLAFPAGEVYACLNIDCSNGNLLPGSSNCYGTPYIPPPPVPPPPAVPAPPGAVPVDCVVGAWTAYGPCSATCNGGTYTHTRNVTTIPQYGGTNCPALSETTPCNDIPCAPPGVKVDCSVSQWSGWSICVCTSGANLGVETSTRYILADPENGGMPCPSMLSQSQVCNCATPPTPQAVHTGSPALALATALILGLALAAIIFV